MKRLAILGASGHGKVVAEIAELSGWQEIVFFDDAWPKVKSIGIWSVEGNTGDLIACIHDFDSFFVAIGNNAMRWEKFTQLNSYELEAAVLVHPSAVISKHAMLNKGSVVMANAVVNPFVSVCMASIVNTGAILDHDCRLESATHVSPGANLAGEVVVGHQSWIGIGASVKQQVVIGSKVTVGAGAAVINDINDGLTVVGVPAIPI